MQIAYPELVAEMAKKRITRVEVAKGIGISPRALYSKLLGKTDFTLSEANAIHKNFFPDVKKDKLFAQPEDNTRNSA